MEYSLLSFGNESSFEIQIASLLRHAQRWDEDNRVTLAERRETMRDIRRSILGHYTDIEKERRRLFKQALIRHGLSHQNRHSQFTN